MRENMGLYRGKRIDNGEWVEGFFVKKTDPLLGSECCFILVQEYDTCCIDGRPTHLQSLMTWYKVIPGTVGECTSLPDKNGKKIFEGDIAREVWGERVYPKRLVVAMDLKRGGWFPYARGDGCGCCEQDVWDDEYTEIIGNIHDNPELLKGE